MVTEIAQEGGINLEQEYKVSLAAARVNANMTQTKAAKEIGIAKQTLIKYEKGITSPTIPTLRRICEVYKVPLDRISFLPISSI